MLQGLTYFPQENVPVIYIGPVPDFKMLAFLLVLERQRPPPEQYELKNVKECFGKKLPSEMTIHDENRDDLTSH